MKRWIGRHLIQRFSVKRARLHEAIVSPYLCIADLRRLATSGDNIQAALKSIDGIPEEVQALVSLLQVLRAV